MEEDWNDRDNWRKKIIVKWAQEDVETSYNLLNNNTSVWSMSPTGHSFFEFVHFKFYLLLLLS